jgi:hypothetical protein
MQFHVDQDLGNAVAGWVVLDNPSAIPKLVISSPGGRAVELAANVLRPDLKNLGMHATGMAGFLVDEQIYPNLGNTADVEIREAESGILIFRRFQGSQHLEQRLFRFELQIMPQAVLENLFAQRFALHYDAVERYAFDTLYAIINNQNCKSIVVSGRPLFCRYQQLLQERDFVTTAMLPDPLEELAARLLFLRYTATKNAPAYLNDHLFGLAPLVELVKHIDFDNAESLNNAFKGITSEQRNALANPSTRVLACNVDEQPEERHVGIALENLASMNLVGLRAHFNEFKSMFAELIGIDILGEYQLPEISWVPMMAGKLALIEPVKQLLALDLAIYKFTKKAVEEVIGKP